MQTEFLSYTQFYYFSNFEIANLDRKRFDFSISILFMKGSQGILDLTSPYIISYLHFLNLNNILTLPQTLVVTGAGFGLTRIMFALFFACQIYTHAR